MVSLVDTNLLVYRFDPRFPQKQRVAAEVLRRGVMNESVRIPHQALMEFVGVTRVQRGAQPLLSHADAWREAEELLTQFTVLYPNAVVFRTALRGAAAYQLSWFDPICGLTQNTMVSTKLSPRISKMADFTVAFGLEIPF